MNRFGVAHPSEEVKTHFQGFGVVVVMVGAGETEEQAWRHQRESLLEKEMSIESQLKKGTKITIEIPWNGEGLDSKEEAPHR